MDGSMQQYVSKQSVDYQGRRYEDMVWLIDYSYDVPLSYQEGKGMVGGYTLNTINTTRLCLNPVPAACLAIKSPDACVNDVIDKALELEVADPPPGSSRTAVIVAVAVSVSVVVLLLGGALVWWLSRRARRRQRLPVPVPKTGSAACSSAEAVLVQDGINPDADSKEYGGSQGWEITSVCTSPLIDQVKDTNIVFGACLGSGSYGRVYKARWAARDVAVKVIEYTSDTAAAVLNEVQLLMSFSHPNIVRAYHAITFTQIASDSDGCGGNQLVSKASSKEKEYCDGGTLSAWVARNLQDPQEPDQMIALLRLLQDAATGLVELHRKHVVHGDLNARNVLVSSTDPVLADDMPLAAAALDAAESAEPQAGARLQTPTAKLADLGMSRALRQHSTHRTTNTVGTMSHMPPELLRYGRMSPAVDIYAFGIMMWELFSRAPAFKHLHYGQFFEHVVLRQARPPLPPDMPTDYSLLMTCCWDTEVDKRPPAAVINGCLEVMAKARAQALRQQKLQQSGHQPQPPTPLPVMQQLQQQLGLAHLP
eukprot:gene11713-11858_t